MRVLNQAGTFVCTTKTECVRGTKFNKPAASHTAERQKHSLSIAHNKMLLLAEIYRTLTSVHHIITKRMHYYCSLRLLVAAARCCLHFAKPCRKRACSRRCGAGARRNENAHKTNATQGDAAASCACAIYKHAVRACLYCNEPTRLREDVGCRSVLIGNNYILEYMMNIVARMKSEKSLWSKYWDIIEVS